MGEMFADTVAQERLHLQPLHDHQPPTNFQPPTSNFMTQTNKDLYHYRSPTESASRLTTPVWGNSHSCMILGFRSWTPPSIGKWLALPFICFAFGLLQLEQIPARALVESLW